MSFNEKLIKLRKENGLSQEELAYKLNVTRQTISKWELGQTTPEMAKLSEISKIFGISIDNLLSDEDKIAMDTENNIEDKPINNRTNKNLISIVLIVIIVLIIVGIFIFIIVARKFVISKEINNDAMKEVTQIVENVVTKTENIIDENNQNIQENNDKFNEVYQQFYDQYDKEVQEMKEEYNNKLQEMKKD